MPDDKTVVQAAMNDHDPILDRAKELVTGDRNEDYGHPLDDYTKTAALMSVILGMEVTAEQAIMCMVAVKLSRCVHEIKEDAVVDIAGYASCLWKTVTERVSRHAVQMDIEASEGMVALAEESKAKHELSKQATRGAPVNAWCDGKHGDDCRCFDCVSAALREMHDEKGAQ